VWATTTTWVHSTGRPDPSPPARPAPASRRAHAHRAESELTTTPFGVLEEAGLVVTRRSGREKLHFLNPVPIRLIHDRWIDKYAERRVSALADLNAELENPS
jgi:hypothetical protein